MTQMNRQEPGAHSTADEVLAGVDMSGRKVLITGGYSGLGKESARAMAMRGADVVLAGRDPARLEQAAREIREAGARGAIDTLVCDLASLESIRECGEQARGRFERIDILLNNAGVMACPKAKTADGFEMQIGTNHLGHFALTAELLELLRKGERVRIVNLSSRGHHLAGVDFDDPHFERRDYDKWIAYGQSKTANVLFTVALEERLKGEGIHAYAVHPGGIMTNLGRHLSEQDIAWLRQRMEEAARKGGGNAELKTVEQGAATQCWAASAEELEGNGGVYCEDCHIAAIDDESPAGGVRSYAVDPENAERLWQWSERETGARMAF